MKVVYWIGKMEESMERVLKVHWTVLSVSIWELALDREIGQKKKEREKLGPEAGFSKVPKTFRARKAICGTANPSFWKADLLTCFQGNKKLNDCEVWRLKSSPFLRYTENCDTRKWSVKFRDVRETGPRGLFLESSENSSGPKSHFGNCYPLVSIDWSLNLFSRYQKAKWLWSLMAKRLSIS